MASWLAARDGRDDAGRGGGELPRLLVPAIAGGARAAVDGGGNDGRLSMVEAASQGQTGRDI